ncbi:MAG: cupin domain-containing protein [Zavarzinella sp.]|nr:cupin domain-containing protein [Zavarzinella sp.]
MVRTLLVLAAGAVVSLGGLAQGRDDTAGARLKVVSERDIAEKLDGKEAKVTVVEVTLEPGQAGTPHRHPGPVFGYVLEGEYEHAINDEPVKVLKAGETFYEPAGCLHRVSKNPGKVRTRVLATVVHPRDAKQLSVPEPKK